MIPHQHGTPVGCARSDHNYPSLVAASIRPSLFRDVSCGSAVTADMTAPQRVSLGGVNPPQFDALSSDTTAVTVGIGGNDADLVGIAESCVKLDLLRPTGSPCKDHYTVAGRDTAAAGVDAIAPRIATVLRGIHARSPGARTLLVGYPAVLPLSGPGCWPLVPLSSGDVPWFRSLLQRIDRVLGTQAAANRAEYVDTYTPSAGHDVCKLPGAKWFEGLIPTSLALPLHPNALGEASMARSVLGVLMGPAPILTRASPRLRITGWALRGGALIVRGTISPAYRGRVAVTVAEGARRDKARVHRTTAARHGRWRIVLRLPRGDAHVLTPGTITATSGARDGLRAGLAHVHTPPRSAR